MNWVERYVNQCSFVGRAHAHLGEEDTGGDDDLVCARGIATHKCSSTPSANYCGSHLNQRRSWVCISHCTLEADERGLNVDGCGTELSALQSEAWASHMCA